MTGNLFASPNTSAPEGWFTAHCDGGSRGNPGPSGYGAVVEDPQGRIAARLSRFLGIQTNNYAEYSGLIAVLEWATENGANRLRVISDSELMVKQMKGQYRVNSPELRPLYEEARRRVPQLEHFQIQHVLREKNRHADRLANLAMDRGMGRAPAANPAPAPARAPAPAPAPPSPSNGVMLRGLVKGGVVHVLGGELPDGVFVKVIPE